MGDRDGMDRKSAVCDSAMAGSQPAVRSERHWDPCCRRVPHNNGRLGGQTMGCPVVDSLLLFGRWARCVSLLAAVLGLVNLQDIAVCVVPWAMPIVLYQYCRWHCSWYCRWLPGRVALYGCLTGMRYKDALQGCLTDASQARTALWALQDLACVCPISILIQ